MAYDPGLAERLRELLEAEFDLSEKQMFGGLAFMWRGYLLVGIVGDCLLARVGPLAYEEALRQPHTRPMDFTGKPMKGYVFVEPQGFEQDSDLQRWLEKCQVFVARLPPK